MWITLVGFLIVVFTLRWVLSWFLPSSTLAGMDRLVLGAGDWTIKLILLGLTGILLWAFVYVPYFAK